MTRTKRTKEEVLLMLKAASAYKIINTYTIHNPNGTPHINISGQDTGCQLLKGYSYAYDYLKAMILGYEIAIRQYYGPQRGTEVLHKKWKQYTKEEPS